MPQEGKNRSKHKNATGQCIANVTRCPFCLYHVNLVAYLTSTIHIKYSSKIRFYYYVWFLLTRIYFWRLFTVRLHSHRSAKEENLVMSGPFTQHTQQIYKPSPV